MVLYYCGILNILLLHSNPIFRHLCKYYSLPHPDLLPSPFYLYLSFAINFIYPSHLIFIDTVMQSLFARTGFRMMAGATAATMTSFGMGMFMSTSIYSSRVAYTDLPFHSSPMGFLSCSKIFNATSIGNS